ncbi:MAG: winged helix-turn-helix domain-containing protein [Brevundimonas sp.]
MSLLKFPIMQIDLFNEPAFRLGAFHARPAVREIEIDRYIERLEPRVFQVLVMLARSPNRTISRDALIAQCWHGRFVSDDALNRTIGKLRQVFARDRTRSVIIETVPRLGYQLRVNRTDVGASGYLREGDGSRIGGGTPDSLPHGVGTRYLPTQPDHRIVVSETLGEAALALGQVLRAIEMSTGPGGSLLKLTIQIEALGPDRRHDVSLGRSETLNNLAAELARYKGRDH